jgi:hypothetical protein
VHLTSHRDQARVELCISGYQFPDVAARDERDWDANWLRVSGVVAQADGKAWSFDDPCLTTWEAEELGSWLSNVAAGTVPPSPFRAGQPENLLVFAEPNLAFGLEAREGDRLRIRVHFSLEALPSWLQGPDRPYIFEYFVGLDVSAADLAQAAEDWTLSQMRFPGR